MSNKRYFGIAKEASVGQTPGTYVYADPESAEIGPAADPVIVYEGMSGLDRQVAAGRYSVEGSIAMPVDENVAGHIFKGVLGGYNVAGAVDTNFTHTFTADRNVIDTYALKVGSDIMEYQVQGSAFSEFSIEAGEGIVKISTSLVGQKDKKGIIVPNQMIPVSSIFTGTHVSFSIEGGDKSADVEALSLKVENGLEPIFGLGSRFPQNYRKGTIAVNAEVTLAFYDTQELERFWGGATGPANDSVTDFDVSLNIGNNLTISIPRAVYTAMAQPVAGRDAITQTASIRGLVDMEGAGPVIISLTNKTAKYN